MCHHRRIVFGAFACGGGEVTRRKRRVTGHGCDGGDWLRIRRLGKRNDDRTCEDAREKRCGTERKHPLDDAYEGWRREHAWIRKRETLGERLDRKMREAEEDEKIRVMRDYASLKEVLHKAYDQASRGKGRERHAREDELFEKQPIVEISRRLKGHPAAGALFQAVKKIYESGGLPVDRALQELYGAINYIAAAVIQMKGEK